MQLSMVSEHLPPTSFPDYTATGQKVTEPWKKKNIYHNTGGGEWFFKRALQSLAKNSRNFLKVECTATDFSPGETEKDEEWQ